jgi:NitT/TauT family transport system ATP-binding protein
MVLDGLNLQIGDGEFVTLIGKSGCGKSTLLNIIAGLDRSFSGELLFGGKPIRSTGPDRIVIFQENALFPWLNVLDNIKFGLRQAGSRKQMRTELAMTYLNMVGLGDFANANIHQLSGGMKQRVSIARALSLNPRILLMDEPFAALDVHTRQMLCGELLRIHKETKKTILFVTHNIEEAVLLGDRVILLSHSTGKIKNQFQIDVPKPRNVNHKGLRAIVSEVLDELRESPYHNEDQNNTEAIPLKN